MKKFLLVLLCGLLSACAPQNPLSIIDDKQQEMADAKRVCVDSTKADEKPHTMAAICTFDAWSSILKKADFYRDMDLLNTYRSDIINATTQWDAKAISDEKAKARIQIANNRFYSSLQMRNDIRQQNYSNAMMATAAGFNQVPQYHPVQMPSYNLTQPPMPPMGVQPDFSLQDNYLKESQRPGPLGMGQGAVGYGGTVYVPAGPNPPVNVMGQ